MAKKISEHRWIRRQRKPGTAHERVEFLHEAVFPAWLNDLTTVVEARCRVPGHGVPGHSANFTACLMCLVACETLADLAAPSYEKTSAACRRWLWRDLSRTSGDPRYEDLGGIMFVWFRHGIAHRLWPKAGGGAMFHLQAVEESACALELTQPAHADRLMELRANWHLRLAKRTLTVLPQVLFADISIWLAEFAGALRANPRRLSAKAFDRWWKETIRVRRISLSAHEWDLVARRRSPNPLRVRSFEPVLHRSKPPIEFWLEWTAEHWVLREAGRRAARFTSRRDAEGHYDSRRQALTREYYRV